MQRLLKTNLAYQTCDGDCKGHSLPAEEGAIALEDAMRALKAKNKAL